MKRPQSFAIMVSIMVLSAGLLLMASPGGTAPPFATPSELTGVTQNWDKNLPSASRFTVLPSFNNAAVRDNNTGLVWERAPDATQRTWSASTSYCVNKSVGGTFGWRLPSVIELKSVEDPSLAAPFVPTSIFTGVPSGSWSATTVADSPTLAWSVHLLSGEMVPTQKTGSSYAWCVRGPMQESSY